MDSEEFRNEIIEDPEQSGMSAGLRQQFALCLSTLQQPFQLSNTTDLPAANVKEVSFDKEPQELNFSEEGLITPDPPLTADVPTAAASATDPSAHVLRTAATADDEPAAVQGCDPAVMFVDEETLNRKLEMLPFPPLPATLKK